MLDDWKRRCFRLVRKFEAPKATSVKWFERHLNYSLALVLFGGGALVWLASEILFPQHIWLTYLFPLPWLAFLFLLPIITWLASAILLLLLSALTMQILWPVGLLVVILCFASLGLSWWGVIWVIRQKKRSLRHLLWSFVPLGFIAWFILRRQVYLNQQKQTG
ncbi:hypothetical protein ES703_87164 [subsurface metagenome]